MRMPQHRSSDHRPEHHLRQRPRHRAVRSVQHSLACLLRVRVMLPPATGRRREAAHGSRAGRLAQNATAALPSQHDLRTFTIIMAERRTGSDGLTAVNFLTRHTAGCRPCRTVPSLPIHAQRTTGTRSMALGKLTPGCTSAVFASTTCPETHGISVTRSAFTRRGGPPAEAPFPRIRRFPKVRRR